MAFRNIAFMEEFIAASLSLPEIRVAQKAALSPGDWQLRTATEDWGLKTRNWGLETGLRYARPTDPGISESSTNIAQLRPDVFAR